MPDPRVRQAIAVRAAAIMYVQEESEYLTAKRKAAKQNPKFHPEGDALYHSLQVFELARQERAYDLEFCLAALLHDVGEAIDPEDHVAAGVQSLRGSVRPRTLGLVEHHMQAHAYRDGTLGMRAKRRLKTLEDFEDLLLLRATCIIFVPIRTR